MKRSPWTNKEFTRQSLERIDAKFMPKTQSQVDYLMVRMNLDCSSKILDLGCGAGRHAIEFAKRGVCVTGIDISDTMLENAKRRTAGENLTVNYIQCDLANLSALQLQEEGYNGAICLCESGIGVIGGENKDFEYFKQVYKLLVPDSYFALTCFNSLRRYIRSKDQNKKFNYIDSTMIWSPPAEFAGERLSEIQRQYAPSEIKMLLTLSGFQKIQILSCFNGKFSDDKMGIEDIEMLVTARK